MNSYNKKKCRKIYEEHGEVGLKHFLKKAWIPGTKKHFKNFYSKNTWQSTFFVDSPFKTIKQGATLHRNTYPITPHHSNSYRGKHTTR